MSSQIDQKRPISPKELFEKLLSGNYKELECVDEVSHIGQQKQILISLISEYRLEIERRIQQFDKLQKLLIIRNKLRVQLQQLRNERISIDRNIEYELEKYKLNPNEVQESSQFRIEIQQLMHKNSNMELRLRQLHEYCVKIQRQNVLLEKENVAVEDFSIRTRSKSQFVGLEQDGCCGNWREKIRTRRMQEEKLNAGLMQRMRDIEQQNRRRVMLKQAQIAQGNRRRMQSFQERLRKY